MSEAPPTDKPEHEESLWMLTISPTIWAAHFLASYCTAAIWCAKSASADASLEPVRWAIAGYTVVALLGIGATGWWSYRRRRLAEGEGPFDFDTHEDRHRFLAFATLLLSGLSAVATLFVALVAVFVRSCQ